jgi:hypothetical protein
MPSTLTATEINLLRTLVNDDSTSKQARAEIPQNTRDGVRTVFQLLHYPIVSSGWASTDTDATNTSVYLTTGTTVRTQTGFKVDVVNGLLTFNTAPTGAEDPWFVDYYWQWASDETMYSLLYIAAYDVGYNPVLLGYGLDPYGTGPYSSPTTTIPTGLTNAWYLYAKHHFFKMMASKYAWRFNSSGGGQGQQVDVVTKSYRELADEAWEEANAMKEAFAKRHGRRDVPAQATSRMSVDPWTPIR